MQDVRRGLLLNSHWLTKFDFGIGCSINEHRKPVPDHTRGIDIAVANADLHLVQSVALDVVSS